MQRTLLISSALIAVFIAAQPSFATSKSIDGSHYDLTMKSDVDALHRDILRAAGDLCEAEVRRSDYRGLVSSNKIRRSCVADVTDTAVRKSGEAHLIAFHKSLKSKERYDVARMSLDEMQLALSN